MLIKYRVRIDEDEYWDDPRSNLKVYKNEVSDEYEHKVAAETTVETSHRILEKTGTQLTDGTEYTNTVLFDVEINPSGADLDPTSDTVTLVDTLTDDTEVSSFSYDSIQLYEYDKDAKDHKGSPISKDDWISNYDPETKTLTVIVDDEKAYVLSYVYTVKKDKIREEKTEISNKAQLNGKWTKEIHVPIREIKAGVIVDKRDITITKVDKDREAKTLSGAKFKLEKYDSEAKEWVFVDDYTTDEKSGSFVLYGSEMDSDVPYRLTETEAPAGYSNKDLNGNEITFYFVVMSKDETEEEAAAKAGLGSMTPSTSDYRFFDYYGGSAAIKDQQIGSLSVSKTVKNGSANDNSKDFSFTVTLSNKTISGKYGDMTFDKGVAKFSLKHGQTKTASGLPTGIKYTVTETAATGYSTTQTGATGTITTKKSEAKFTNTPDTVKVDVTKVWVDGENAKNTRPAAVTIKLLANGKDTGKTLELNAKNEWKGSFDGLDKNDANGEITYTIEEDSVGNYMVAITGNAANGFTVTNTLKTNIAVEKVWNDANNQDGKRPASITVHLKKNGVDLYSATLNESNGWKRTWPNLPAYDEDGKEITYSVTEVCAVSCFYSCTVTSFFTVR